MGWHNYYRYATHVSYDFSEIAFLVKSSIKGKLERQMKKQVSKPIRSPVYQYYTKSKEIRFIGDTPLIPISYVKHKNPMDKKKIINKYTPMGRAEIHKKLDKVDMSILHYLMQNPNKNESIEYNDNRLALYCANQGKCAVTLTKLDNDRIHCHHKTPRYMGGIDNYANLILIDVDVHILIHAKTTETIETYSNKLNLNEKQLAKVNALREILCLEMI